MTNKVFISYSDRSGKYAALRDQFIADLGIPVWYDEEELAVGDRWLRRITDGLGSCYAGVFLVSKDALASDFVKYEISWLLQRSRMHSGFKLFALVLDDATTEDLNSGFFGAIKFLDHQVGPYESKHADVIATLKALRPAELTPTRELEDYLTPVFRDVPLSSLRRIAQGREWRLHDMLGPEAERLQFVRLLVASDLGLQLKILREVKKGLPPSSPALEVFEKLAPTWVNENAGLCLTRVRTAPLGMRTALVNGALPEFTVRMFLQRARPIAEVGPLSSQPLSGRQALEKAAAALRASIVEDLRLELPDGLGPNEIEDFVNAGLDAADELDIWPVHALLIDKPLDLPIVTALQKRFPRVTFVAMTKTEVPPNARATLGHVEIIDPPLRDSGNHHNETYASGYYTRRRAALE